MIDNSELWQKMLRFPIYWTKKTIQKKLSLCNLINKRTNNNIWKNDLIYLYNQLEKFDDKLRFCQHLIREWIFEDVWIRQLKLIYNQIESFDNVVKNCDYKIKNSDNPNEWIQLLLSYFRILTKKEHEIEFCCNLINKWVSEYIWQEKLHFLNELYFNPNEQVVVYWEWKPQLSGNALQLYYYKLLFTYLDDIQIWKESFLNILDQVIGTKKKITFCLNQISNWKNISFWEERIDMLYDLQENIDKKIEFCTILFNASKEINVVNSWINKLKSLYKHINNENYKKKICISIIESTGGSTIWINELKKLYRKTLNYEFKVDILIELSKIWWYETVNEAKKLYESESDYKKQSLLKIMLLSENENTIIKKAESIGYVKLLLEMWYNWQYRAIELMKLQYKPSKIDNNKDVANNIKEIFNKYWYKWWKLILDYCKQYECNSKWYKIYLLEMLLEKWWTYRLKDIISIYMDTKNKYERIEILSIILKCVRNSLAEETWVQEAIDFIEKNKDLFILPKK